MQYRGHPRSIKRQAFTLVEMLVATALIIFVMLILTTVFTAGLSALRNMRGLGHLQDNLRQILSTIRDDLSAEHFDDDQGNGPVRYLNDVRLDQYDSAVPQTVGLPPKRGFFRIWQGAPSYPEGGMTGTGTPMVMDGEGSPSYVMSTYGLDPSVKGIANNRYSYMHFTVRRNPKTRDTDDTINSVIRDRYFSTSTLFSLGLGFEKYCKSEFRIDNTAAATSTLADPGIIYSSWAEIAYFLQPSGQTAGNTPLYSLYRRKRFLLEANPLDVGAIPITSAQAAQSIDVSYPLPASSGASVSVNTPTDVTQPIRRLGMDPNQKAGIVFNQSPPRAELYSPHTFYPLYNLNDPATEAYGGDDLLLENVLSFDIKANWDVPPIGSPIDRRAQGVTLPRPVGGSAANAEFPAGATANPDYPFDDLPITPAGFGNDSYLTPKWPPPPLPLGTPSPRVFDTWSNQGPYANSLKRYETGGPGTGIEIPLRIRIKALQIRIRVWDAKTQQTRQITIIQDM